MIDDILKVIDEIFMLMLKITGERRDADNTKAEEDIGIKTTNRMGR